MRPKRHNCLVLLYCKKHNEAINRGQDKYLNPYSFANSWPINKRRYACNKDDEGVSLLEIDGQITDDSSEYYNSDPSFVSSSIYIFVQG